MGWRQAYVPGGGRGTPLRASTLYGQGDARGKATRRRVRHIASSDTQTTCRDRTSQKKLRPKAPTASDRPNRGAIGSRKVRDTPGSILRPFGKIAKFHQNRPPEAPAASDRPNGGAIGSRKVRGIPGSILRPFGETSKFH